MKRKSLNFNLTEDAIAKYKFAAKVGTTTAVAGTAGLMSYYGVKSLRHTASKILCGTISGLAIGVPFAFAILLEYRSYILETEHHDIIDDISDWVERIGLGMPIPDYDDIEDEDYLDDFDDDFFDVKPGTDFYQSQPVDTEDNLDADMINAAVSSDLEAPPED